MNWIAPGAKPANSRCAAPKRNASTTAAAKSPNASRATSRSSIANCTTRRLAVQEISTSRESYQQHLDVLRSLHMDSSVQSDEDMDRAIGAVEDAENEFSKTSRRLASVLPKLGIEGFAPQQNGMTPQKFRTWLIAGAAFTLPLTVAALLVAFIIKHLA